MNAIEQTRTLSLASKIAQAAQLFQVEFPQTTIDLAPWSCEASSDADPYSVDMSVLFRGMQPECECCCILLQIRFNKDLRSPVCQILGIEARGYAAHQEKWRMSTIGCWSFEGDRPPRSSAQKSLKTVFRQILTLFSVGVEVA